MVPPVVTEWKIWPTFSRVSFGQKLVGIIVLGHRNGKGGPRFLVCPLDKYL